MNDNGLAIGTPAYARGDVGYIADIRPAGNITHTIGAGGLQRCALSLEIAFSDRLATVSDVIAANWIGEAQAMGIGPLAPETVAARRQDLQAKAAERLASETQAKAQRDADRAAFLADAAGRVPADARAVIVAELIQNESDSMSDYWNGRTVRVVILAFSHHTRDLFPEFRKAALNFPDTVELATAPEDAEHREKYSMGGGFYLKASSRYSDGWRIKKYTLYDGVKSLPSGEWSLAPVDNSSAAAALGVSAPGFSIESHAHTKHGFQMSIVILAGRSERAEFDRLLQAAKARRGWYTRPFGKVPGGFAFKDHAAALAFAESDLSGAPEAAPAAAAVSGGTSQPARPGAPSLAVKFRTLADGMQGDIEHRFADRLTNTPKRQREAQSQRLEGLRLQRTQAGLRALADLHDAGNVPAVLRSVTTKAAAYALAAGEIKASGGYYDAGRETGQPARATPEALAFWALISGPSAADVAARDLRDKIEALQFAKIPGYFPTPPAVVARMIEAADIPAGARVLEPSGGSGAILDAIRDAVPDARLCTYERHASLRAILTAKGHEVRGEDFLQSEHFRVERVLMNPPFENGQDMAHVRHAFNHLTPDGRLIAIMSPGSFFRQDRAAVDFRAWFDAVGGEKVNLPSGAFKASGTGVETVMIEIRA